MCSMFIALCADASKLVFAVIIRENKCCLRKKIVPIAKFKLRKKN